MRFATVTPDRLEREWPNIAETIWPAVRRDPNLSMEEVRRRIVLGWATVLRVSDGADGYLLLEVGEDRTAWVLAAAGKIEGAPKVRIAAMREVMTKIEMVARSIGCTRVRLCGRDYSRLFPDYTPFEGKRYGLEKVF